MMLPPEDLEREPYDVPRGACPACGSGDVTHLVIGMPSGPGAMEGDPDWVHWVGCVHPGMTGSAAHAVPPGVAVPCLPEFLSRCRTPAGEFARAADGARRGRCARRNR